MSSRIIISSIPFATHFKQGAGEILARDQARAQKFLQGLHPHGPLSRAAASTRSTHHHRRKHHPKGGATAPDGSTGDAETSPDSIDVTDAGNSYHKSTCHMLTTFLSCHIHYVCRRWLASNPVHSFNRYRYSVKYIFYISAVLTLLFRKLEHVCIARLKRINRSAKPWILSWVGAGTKYKQTSTSKATGNTVVSPKRTSYSQLLPKLFISNRTYLMDLVPFPEMNVCHLTLLS